MLVRFLYCLNEKEFNLFGTRQCQMKRLLITFNELFFGFIQPGHIWDGFVFVLPCEVYETSPTPSHHEGRRKGGQAGAMFWF